MYNKTIIKTDDEALQSYYNRIKLYDLPVHPNIKDVFNFANSCRDKEIDRFWSRGMYFWGFIVASFGAYMAVLNSALQDGAVLSFESVCSVTFFSKVILFVLSFVCFIFCLSWQLVHKASKYWQENWETHVCYLEKEYIGRIYETPLDTNKDSFRKNLFSTSAYNFSVSKISLFCSILMAIVSFLSWVFHSFLLFNFWGIDLSRLSNCCVFKIVVVCLPIGFMVFYFINTRGNKQKKDKTKTFVQSTLSDKIVE